MLRHREFDVAEMSLSSYTLSLFRDDPPFIAIPIFPSRYFRHSCIYISADSGIREPKDLIGKRVGNPEYQMTAPVWIRGILRDEYGVPVDSVHLFQRRRRAARPHRKNSALAAARDPPRRRFPPARTLSHMLETGEIDALYTAARAVDVFQRFRQSASPVPRLPGGRTRILIARPESSRHAHHRYPPRSL